MNVLFCNFFSFLDGKKKKNASILFDLSSNFYFIYVLISEVLIYLFIF